MYTKVLTMDMPKLKILLAAGTMLGAIGLFSAANANLTITPGNGSTSGVSATSEPALDGGPGFPLNLFGYTNGATLNAIAGESYVFTFEGAGTAGNTSTFTFSLGGGPSWTWVGNGGTGAGSTPAGSTFSWTAPATEAIPFVLKDVTTGCTISDGTAPNPNGSLSCSYLVALGNSTSSPGTVGPDGTAWIGFSDVEVVGAGSTPDFQDGVIKVAEVPEPATIGLFSLAVMGLTGLRRKRQRV